MTQRYSKITTLLIGLLGLFCLTPAEFAAAQTVTKNTPTIKESRAFDANETFAYTLDFKWGIIRGKVGEATLTNRPISGGQYFSQLLFRTRGLGDTFYKMRDTLETLYSPERLPLRFEKRIDEAGFEYRDLVTFTHRADDKVLVNVKAGTPEELRQDTTFYLSSAEAEVIDMLSALNYLRALNPGVIEQGFLNRFIIPIGRDIVYGNYEFGGYETVKMPDGTTMEGIKIYFNIADESFSQTSRSIEAWLTNDERLIPVKIIAKLALGRVECTLSSFRRN